MLTGTARKAAGFSKRAPADAPASVPAKSIPAPVHRLSEIATAAPEAHPNRTGLPDQLKAGFEAYSGVRLDDVRVRRGSPHPREVGARAYARGSEIHLGPGHDRELAHEAWHVVQQKQGRVRETSQSAQGAPVNDDPVLEREAEAMSARGVASAGPSAAAPSLAVPSPLATSAGAGPMQMSGGSSRANEQLRKAMGKKADRVTKLPNAKPHTKSGTGSSGTDHQARNASAINQSLQKTKWDSGNPTMFAASQMRSSDSAKIKDAAAASKRAEKKADNQAGKDAAIREFYDLADHEPITKDHREEYRELNGEQ